MSQSLSNRLASAAVKYRWLALSLATVITLLLATGMLRLQFDASLYALLTRSDPYLEEYERLREEFPVPSEISFAFAATNGAPAFSTTVLDAIAELETRFREIPGAIRFASLTDYFSPETQQRLFQRPLADYSNAELRELGDQARQDRLLTTNLLAEDGSLAIANISLNDEPISDSDRLAITEAVFALQASLSSEHPDVDIRVNSDLLLEQSSRDDMVEDLTTLLPIVILVCVSTICWCFRSAVLGLCMLSQVILTIACTVGLLSHLGFAFNTISIIAPLVVVIIAVANSVHVVSIYRQGLYKDMTREQAMQHSLAYNLRPISLAALTTAIGFTSLNLCSSPAIQDFGRIVGTGIVFAYLLTLTTLPALLIRFGTAIQRSAGTQTRGMQSGLMRLNEFVARRDRSLFYGCTVLALGTLALLPLNETDFNRLEFIPADSAVRQYYDLVADRMDRGPLLTYGINTGSIDGAIEPAFLRDVERFADWLDEQLEVESAASVVDVVKTIAVAANSDDPSFYRIPDTIDDTAYYLNSYEVVESEDFPLSGFLNRDWSTATLFVNARPMTNQSIIDLDEKISARFASEFPELELIHGSAVLLFARMDELVTMELLQGYSVSLLLITLTLIVGLRSVYFGILSIIPNLLPATVVFGVWGLFVGQLDPFVMMLFSISIGMVVDDTVHILSHYLQGREAGADQNEAITHAIRVAGPALTITTLILALGTTILIAANTLYFQQSAKLLVPIVVLALVLDLVYFPTILRRFDRRRLVHGQG